MKITLTDKGLQALAQNQTVQLLDFIAGDSKSLSTMEKYVAGQSVGSNTFYQYGIEENHTYVKGDTYTPSDGSKPYKVENTFLEVRGTLNCLNVPSSFTMRSMGIKAKIGNNPPFVYAFGSISSSDKPYPINKGEAVTYITPIKIIYDNASNVTTEESGVPWKNFIQHTVESVTSENGAHGLKINPVTKELTVGDTTVILSGGDERIAELEEEVQGVLKYSQREDGRKYVSEWVESLPEGDGSSLNPYKITNPYHLTLVGSLGSGSVYYSLEANLDLRPCTVGPNATWSISENIVTFQNVDKFAPCYNKGMGFPCLRLANGSVFNGNNHFIKGLVIGASINSEIGVSGGIYETVPYGLSKNNYIDYRSSLFCQITANNPSVSRLSNLNLIDSVIILGYDLPRGNMKVSSFCGYLNNGVIENCASNATLVVTQINSYAGGIIGEGNSTNDINFCAFRGAILGSSQDDRSFVGCISGNSIPLLDYISHMKGCYSTATLNFGNLRAFSGYSFGMLTACYFAGYIQPDADMSDIGTMLRQSSNTNKINLSHFTSSCYSLEGSSAPQRIQGTVLSREYMQSESFVNDLNNQLGADSENPIFVYKPGDFPRLWFEEDEKPLNAQIAAINIANKKVLDSGYTVQTLANVPTVQDLAGTYRRLSGIANAKSRVTGEEVAIPLSSWSNKRYRYYTSSVGYQQSLDNIILVPESSDFFNYGISANQTGTDSNHDPYTFIDFTCSTLPTSDISFRIIVIEGPIGTA